MKIVITDKLRNEIYNNAIEFETYKEMALGKLYNNELTCETLSRLIDQIYFTGRFIGRLEHKYYED